MLQSKESLIHFETRLFSNYHAFPGRLTACFLLPTTSYEWWSFARQARFSARVWARKRSKKRGGSKKIFESTLHVRPWSVRNVRGSRCLLPSRTPQNHFFPRTSSSHTFFFEFFLEFLDHPHEAIDGCRCAPLCRTWCHSLCAAYWYSIRLIIMEKKKYRQACAALYERSANNGSICSHHWNVWVSSVVYCVCYIKIGLCLFSKT